MKEKREKVHHAHTKKHKNNFLLDNNNRYCTGTYSMTMEKQTHRNRTPPGGGGGGASSSSSSC